MPVVNPRLRCALIFAIYGHSCLIIHSIRGRVFKELGYRRSDLIITTKVFWGARKGPNAQGLSRKQSVNAIYLPDFNYIFSSIIEGTKESLERLQMDYVDVIFAHRCDITVPMVRMTSKCIILPWHLMIQ